MQHPSLPPPGLAGLPPPRQLLLSVWVPTPGGFAARAVLADGSLRDFDSPFELVRFLSAPTRELPASLSETARETGSGLR
jgi:hypothetical protein